MTQLILNVPDTELDFFMALVKKFKYQLVKGPVDIGNQIVSEKDKDLVRQRIKNSKTENLLDWETEQNNFDGI